jgi:hypothetical protein
VSGDRERPRPAPCLRVSYDVPLCSGGELTHLNLLFCALASAMCVLARFNAFARCAFGRLGAFCRSAFAIPRCCFGLSSIVGHAIFECSETTFGGLPSTTARTWSAQSASAAFTSD